MSSISKSPNCRINEVNTCSSSFTCMILNVLLIALCSGYPFPNIFISNVHLSHSKGDHSSLPWQAHVSSKTMIFFLSFYLFIGRDNCFILTEQICVWSSLLISNIVLEIIGNTIFHHCQTLVSLRLFPFQSWKSFKKG